MARLTRRSEHRIAGVLTQQHPTRRLNSMTHMLVAFVLHFLAVQEANHCRHHLFHHHNNSAHSNRAAIMFPTVIPAKAGIVVDRQQIGRAHV